MQRPTHVIAGAMIASLAAGPVFLLALCFAAVLAAIPEPIVPQASWITATLIVIPAFIIGLIVSMVPNIICASVLSELATHAPEFRTPPLWAAIGGLVTGVPGILLEAQPEILFPFIATSTICALLCRAYILWEEPGHPEVWQSSLNFAVAGLGGNPA